jgi:hypothetical protein
MRCFYHPEKDAVALCKSCGKGVCPECSADLGKGVACRGRCEDDARGVIQLVERNVQIFRQGVGAVTVQQPARGLPSASGHSLSATVTGHLQQSRRFKLSIGVFHLVVGVFMVGWGASDIDRLLWLLLLGVCFGAYGVFTLLQVRSSTVQKPNTRTA